MNEELRAHIEQATERFVARGMSREAAAIEARREFGNRTVIEDDARSARGLRWLESIGADLRYAARYLMRHKLTTTTVVLVLSLGIGANTAVFTIVQAVTSRPAPGVPHDDALVEVYGLRQRERGQRWTGRDFSYGELVALREQTMVFDGAAGFAFEESDPALRRLGPARRPRRVRDRHLLLDARRRDAPRTPTAGKRRRAGRRPAARRRDLALALGDALREQRQHHRHGRAAQSPGRPHRRRGATEVRGRDSRRELRHRLLDSDVGARRDARVATQLADRSRHGRVHCLRTPGAGRDARTGHSRRARGRARGQRQACVAGGAHRSSERGRASAAQQSHGRRADHDSSPRRDLGGGAADPARDVHQRQLAAGRVRGEPPARDRGAALSRGVAVARGAAARHGELAPRGRGGRTWRRALRRPDACTATRVPEPGPFAEPGDAGVHAGICRRDGDPVRSVARAARNARNRERGEGFGVRQPPFPPAGRVRRGADRADAAAAGVARLPAVRGDDGEQEAPERRGRGTRHRLQFRGERVEAHREGTLRGDPRGDGSCRAGAWRHLDRAGSTLVLRHQRHDPGRGACDGRPLAQGARHAFVEGAAPGYFATVEKRILRGRDVSLEDTTGVHGSDIPIVIPSDLARDFWGAADPLGRRLQSNTGSISWSTGHSQHLVVVGVYDAEETSSRRPLAARIYTARGKRWDRSTFLVKTSGPAVPMLPKMRELLAEFAHDVPGQRVETLNHRLYAARKRQRDLTTAVAGGVALAMSLTSIGLYGLVALAVGQRRREIGVRIAIGGRPMRVAGMFFANGVKLSLIGLAIGLPLSGAVLWFGAQRLVGGGLLNVPLLVAGVAVVVVAVSSIATWIPARRAASVDPAIALRAD